ncbi:Oxygen regulatory protein NreC [wastewater metagenome]|uniref:Oxygen regulatory protein NreC n=2 Tax=unclassified sequences TaxID=12908 RepID=A0A5B8RB64_9ZZZZ|nr:response regulator transcription factor [Arhodomonas sp. KWT]QEA05188.1 oxygen regulatory protein NreC [uncultured organism]
MTRIVVADDHAVVRDGLREMIDAETDFTFVGEAENGAQLLALLGRESADVALVDMSMPGRSGVDLIRQVREERPDVRLLVFSMHSDEQYGVRAVRAGASGYLPKTSRRAEIAEAIRKVAAGGVFLRPELMEKLALGMLGTTERPPHEALSAREYQVFVGLANGRTVSAIADELCVSIKTVSSHKARLMEKMQFDNLAELFRYAFDHGLAGTPGPGDVDGPGSE